MITVPVIQKCSHPFRIEDKTKGGYLYVPCGHCEACLKSYRSKWMERLDCEAKSSACTLFFTLTYDNDNIPKFTFDKGANALFSNRSSDDDIYLDDYIAEESLNNWCLHPNSFPQLQNYESENITIGYCCKADIQKFFKRLRRRVEYDRHNLISNVKKENRSFRYFITSEYGPTTFRPHYHGLMFFDNISVAKAVEEVYLRECWQLCDPKNLDCSRVFGDASAYVAKYVRGFANSPDILKIASKTAVFYLCSRRPAIGVPFFDYSSMVSKVQCNTAKYDKLFIQDGVPTTVSLPIFSSATNFFFPKIYKSSSYDTKDLCAFYNRVFEYVSLWDRRKVDSSTLSYKAEYDYYSTLLPNVIKTVRNYVDDYSSRDGLASTGKLTLSDIYHTLTPFEIAFGIPQNRSALIKFIIFSRANNLSVYQYVENYQRLYSIRYSDSMQFMYEQMEKYRLAGYSNLQLAAFFYPTFFETLPNYYPSLDINHQLLIDLQLSNLNIEYSDVYDEKGYKRKSFENIQAIYRNTSLYKSFIIQVKESNLTFEKKRKLNHFINQKQKNYEAF
jgi:hypothetical protein